MPATLRPPLAALFPIFVLALPGCGNRHIQGIPNTQAVDPWVLSCYSISATEPAYLTNGLVGVRFQRDGTGTGPILLSDQFDAKEDILPLPNPLREQWTGFDLGTASDYAQLLDMRTGVLTTSWHQKGIEIKCQTVLAPDRMLVAERWDMRATEPTRIDCSESGYGISTAPLMDQSSAEVRVFREDLSPKVSIETALRLPHDNSFSCFNLHTIGTAPTHRQITIEQVWDLQPQPKESIQNFTFEAVRNESSSEWAKRWKTDIVIDGPTEDQQAIHSWLFYLRADLSGHSGADYSPMGLSSQNYKGHVFWDADLWMFPALNLIDPDSMMGLCDYRLQQGRLASAAGPGGAIEFPWESAVTGKELAPDSFQAEIHVTGDVAFMLQEAAALGLADPNQANEVLRGATRFYVSRARNGGRYLHLNKVRGADEYYEGDDDLYTNALAQWLVDRDKASMDSRGLGFQGSKVPRFQNSEVPGREGSEVLGRRVAQAPMPPTSGQDTTHRTQDIRKLGKPLLVPSSFFLPHDSQSLIEFPNDPVRNYEQADALLTIYPLQNSTALGEAQKLMERITPKMNATGPAMTDSVDALIWARLGQTETAYTLWKRSWGDFSDHPLGLFSEDRHKDRTYFQTGAAGCLQTVIYGFLGFRIDWQKDEKAEWETSLDQGYKLTVNPHLPSAWKKVVFRNFSVLGRRSTLTATHSGITVTQGEP